jgi:hypothetical protein
MKNLSNKIARTALLVLILALTVSPAMFLLRKPKPPSKEVLAYSARTGISPDEAIVLEELSNSFLAKTLKGEKLPQSELDILKSKLRIDYKGIDWATRSLSHINRSNTTPQDFEYFAIKSKEIASKSNSEFAVVKSILFMRTYNVEGWKELADINSKRPGKYYERLSQL